MNACVTLTNGYYSPQIPLIALRPIGNLKVNANDLTFVSRRSKLTIKFDDIEDIGLCFGLVEIRLKSPNRYYIFNYDRLWVATWDNRKFIKRLPLKAKVAKKIPFLVARINLSIIMLFYILAPIILLALFVLLIKKFS